MVKQYKKHLIISSIVILLPILAGLLLWNQLPANMTSHWGADGVADGTAPKIVMVFVMPLVLLALHWLLFWASFVLDKKNAQNGKMVVICHSIIPVLSLVVHTIMYSVALEKDWNVMALVPALVGAMFVFIGNYMPKTTRNRTMGIKLTWTMGNDENWNKTHRLGGKIYFWGGLVVIASALLPVKFMIATMVSVIAVSIIIPTAYSYSIYKKHKAAGVQYEPVFDQKSDKVAKRITIIAVPLVLIGVTVLLFTGNIKVTFAETSFKIKASYIEDLTVNYADVESIEYREEFDSGVREMGFGSPRLSMGTFRNDEFGRYTIYAYTKAESYVVLHRDGKVLVIAGKTAQETKAIYDTLVEKIK